MGSEIVKFFFFFFFSMSVYVGGGGGEGIWRKMKTWIAVLNKSVKEQECLKYFLFVCLNSKNWLR